MVGELRVKCIKGKAVEAAKMMSDQGITYGQLLRLFGNPAGVYDFINTIYNLVNTLQDYYQQHGVRFTDNWPWLDQEGEAGMWKGQPIVWDGTFGLRDKRLMYFGYSGASGSGQQVERQVMLNDVIIWHRCEDIRHYEGRIEYEV